MSGHRLAEEEEMHRHDLATPLGRSTPAISSLPARTYVPHISSTSEATDRPPVELRMPPVCLATLTSIEAQMSPPPLEICHELLFDPKAKLFLKDLPSPPSGPEAQLDEEYWKDLGRELQALGVSPSPSSHSPSPALMLQQLLYEIRSMLIHLYPQSSQLKELLLPGFDAPHIVNLIRMGSSDDVQSFLQVFGAVLKANCAPKRDVIVENMMRLGSTGDWVGFFRQSLDLMRLMKMDLVNYRLSRTRNKVLATLVGRERAYFRTILAPGTVAASACRQWVRACMGEAAGGERGETSNDQLWTALLGRYLDVLFGMGQTQAMPETFALDRRRLADLQRIVQNITILGSAMLIFGQLVGKGCRPSTLLEAKIRLAREISKPDGHVSELASQILLVASREQGRSFSSDQRRLLAGLVDRIMDPASAVYQAVTRATRRTLEACLEGRKLSEEYCRRSGIESVWSDLETVVPHVKLLWDLHWRVHQSFYRTLLSADW